LRSFFDNGARHPNAWGVARRFRLSAHDAYRFAGQKCHTLSREQAAAALVRLGARAVIAPAFNGLYFRNAFNVGLFFACRVPLLANMVEGGKTPVQSAQTLTQLGYRIVIFPGGTARAVAHTLQGYYGSLRAHGTTAPWRERMLDFETLNALIGTPELMAESKRYE
jgi:2-methylisocitrate lyase-like PEP mutase family enzyme